MVGNSDDKPNFLHKLLLTNREVLNLCKVFGNNFSVNIKLSKTQLSKIILSGRFLGRLFGPLLQNGLPLMKNVLQSLGKSILIQLELTAAASVIHKKS